MRGIAVAAGDFVTGPFFGFDLFYLVPVLLATWYHGRSAGIALALAGSVTWAAVQIASGHPSVLWLLWIWNTSLRFAVTAFVAWLVARMREQMAEQRRLIGELERAAAEISTLGGLLPICAWCKKIRNDEGYWEQIEQFISEHTDATFTHGICPECAKQLMESSPRHGGRKSEDH